MNLEGEEYEKVFRITVSWHWSEPCRRVAEMESDQEWDVLLPDESRWSSPGHGRLSSRKTARQLWRDTASGQGMMIPLKPEKIILYYVDANLADLWYNVPGYVK